MHVVLVRPEIAPNTGNIIRLCANSGAKLHLVEPLGFTLDDRLLRRAGLDYHESASVEVHSSIEELAASLKGRWFAFSSSATRRHTDVGYRDDDVLVFGAERSGLARDELDLFPADRRLVIPMRPGNRSLNLANAAAIVVYEAWRQRGFAGAASDPGSSTGDVVGERPGLTSETPGGEPFDP